MTIRVMLVLTAAFLLLTAGCSRDVPGAAKPDPDHPPVALSEDGAGIVAGYPDAPVQIEIYTEPQCKTCAELQADFGDDLRSYISLGQLAVTYRPVLFSDTDGDDYSTRVSNALFNTADPATPAPAFQAFVKALWDGQKSGKGPSNSEMADLAEQSGVPSTVVDRIASGKQTVDVQDKVDSNLTFLFEVNALDPSTPTIYDIESDEVLDVYDNNWLAKLMSKH